MTSSGANTPFVAIACGGTGGHLFPGLAVAEQLQKRGGTVALPVSPKDVDQEAVKSVRGMETVIGETRRLTFHVTPLSARGLLSAQVRDALKALTRETGSNPVLKIRAFVAGSGDLRRVRDLVSEAFTLRRLPLPALSLIRAGGLPLEGAQVVLEAIAAGKKEVSDEHTSAL